MFDEPELGPIIRRFLPELIKQRWLTKDQLKVLHALENCRTPQMGGSMLACSACGSVHYVLHSCRNRHCPRCQGIDKELWIADRQQELLPVKYYHVVFTVPHLLLELLRYNCILKVTDTHVTFSWCDRKNNYNKEVQTITGVEFLKRFVEHIVPPYFRRIRHFAF